jgi:hypothetical protein
MFLSCGEKKEPSAPRRNPMVLRFLIWAKTRSYPKASVAICVNGWAVTPLKAAV